MAGKDGEPIFLRRDDYAHGPSLKKKACCLTVCVTGAGTGVDNAWEQRKLEAGKMLVNRADSPASSARFVGQCFERFTLYCTK